MSATITIAGKSIPVADLEAAANVLITGARSKKTPEEIARDLGPALLPLVEDVANIFFPGSGTAIELISFVLKYQKPFWTLPQEEQNRIQDGHGRPDA